MGFKVEIEDIFPEGIEFTMNGYRVAIDFRTNAWVYRYGIEIPGIGYFYLKSSSRVENLLKAIQNNDRKVLGLIRLICLFSSETTKSNYLDWLLYRYPVDEKDIRRMLKTLKAGLLISASWKRWHIIEPAVEILNEIGYRDVAEELWVASVSHAIKS